MGTNERQRKGKTRWKGKQDGEKDVRAKARRGQDEGRRRIRGRKEGSKWKRRAEKRRRDKRVNGKEQERVKEESKEGGK